MPKRSTTNQMDGDGRPNDEKRFRTMENKDSKEQKQQQQQQQQLFFQILPVIFQQNQIYFQLKDLQNLMNTCQATRQLLQEEESAASAWEGFLVQDKHLTREKCLPLLGAPAPFGFISRKQWASPDRPENVFGTRQLQLPPRPHSRHVHFDGQSMLPHRNDTADRGLVWARNALYENEGVSRFNPATGVLEDLAFPQATGMFNDNEEIWIPRPLPIFCQACRCTCNSYSGLIDHCTTWEHHNNSIPEDRRLPEEFEDPRNIAGFDNLTPFHKTKAILKWVHAVNDKLMAPMDDAAKENMARLLGRLTENDADGIMFGINIYYIFGMCQGMLKGFFQGDSPTAPGISVQSSVRDVLTQGWGAFRWDREGIEYVLTTIIEETPPNVYGIRMEPPAYY